MSFRMKNTIQSREPGLEILLGFQGTNTAKAEQYTKGNLRVGGFNSQIGPGFYLTDSLAQ